MKRHRCCKSLVIPWIGLLLFGTATAVPGSSETTGPRIVSAHKVVFEQAPKRIPSNGSTDAPLLGNGDFLAALGGPAEMLQFYLSKADLWEIRPDAGPRGLGRVDLALPSMKGASYRVTQDLLHATTTGSFEKDGVTLTVESAVAATENILWVTLSATGGEVKGSALLKNADQESAPEAIADNDRPVTIGKEGHGGGRYYFDGEIGDVVVSPSPTPPSAAGKPVTITSFDGKTTSRELTAPQMTNAASVGAWIKINRAAEANYILSKGEWNSAYSLGLSGGCLRWSVNGTFIQTEKPLETGKWMHVAATFEPGAMRLLINGKSVAEKAPPKGTSGVQVIERRYEKGMERPTGAACALRALRGEASVFMVSPGKPVTLILSASGVANTADYRAAAIRRATEASAATFSALTRAHTAWWADFWSKSFIEIPDKALEQRYYLSHYCMASCSRLRHFPPALYGWTLSEQTPQWGGAYFLNYNFYAPFYGLYAANHIEQALPANDAIIDSLELGREWCKDEAKYERMCSNNVRIKDGKGILLPVSILPYGVTGAPTTWGQRSNAAYCCVPIASTWHSTYDLNFAKQAYPFVWATAEFWEHYLVLENGRYVDKDDAALENSGRDTNPIVSLAMVRLVMDLAKDMSTELGVDRDKHAKWTDIHDRLSDYPTCTVGDLPPGSRIELPGTPETKALSIFRYSESGQAWQNDNAAGIQHIFPGNGIGLGKRPELLERARNQIKVMARWIDLNGCNSFYPAAARVGYDPEIILQKLGHWTTTASPNGMRSDNPHGTEQFSVVPCTLQEMLFQSYDSMLRFFPNWPKAQDARFGTLRAHGAFLVSAELNDGQIGGVKITSEKGRDCTVVNPWPGKKVQVFRNGKPSESIEGERLTFPTSTGETLELKAK
jgi:hypothetical protein